MRIAQIAPLSVRVPPVKYGGTERVVSALTEELVKRGHDVTLFASGNSLSSAKLFSVYPTSLVEAKILNPFGINPLSMLHVGKAYQLQDQFDIIHDHNEYLSVPLASFSNTPVVMTLHGAITKAKKKLFQELRGPYYVTISKAQAASAPGLRYAGTVYHGLDMEQYPFSDTDGGYLLFVGRIAREKGVHYAIKAAERLNLPLLIAAKLDAPDVLYFQRFIKPHLKGNITWLGEVEEKKRNELMSKATCLLQPVTWPEPFGLSLIEAMGCGCPVIAFHKGSIPEIVVNGKTGYVVNTVDEMVAAVKKIKQINRKECRKYVLENFTVKKMVDGYERVFNKILNNTYNEKDNYIKESIRIQKFLMSHFS